MLQRWTESQLKSELQREAERLIRAGESPGQWTHLPQGDNVQTFVQRKGPTG